MTVLKIPNFKNSKFRELVKKHVLATRLQMIREQHVVDLSDAMESLKKQREDIEQEAKEKMVCVANM